MRLSAHDASFLYTETAASPMHGVGITVVGGRFTYEDYFAYLEERIHLVPRFRQRLAFVPGNIAHPKWVDDPDFDLRNHVKPHKVRKSTSIERISDVALPLGEPLLDRSRPLWLTYVIENVQGKTVLVSMAHHAMVDGATGVEIGRVLADFEPDPPPVPPPTSAWKPAPMPTPQELFMEAVQENAAAALEAAQTRGERELDPVEAMRAASILQRFVTEPVMTAPWNAGLVGPKRRIDGLDYMLDHFKGIKNALGGTINDVCLAAVSEGAARYMRDHDEITAGQYLRIMVPVNVRKQGDDSFGNHVSSYFPRLPAWPMDMKERYEAVKATMQRMKTNKEADTLHKLMEAQPPTSASAMAGTLAVGTPFDPTVWQARYPTPVAPRAGMRPPLVGFNFTCSNVPGLEAQQYICGHPVLSGAGTIMLSGTLGYGVVCSSGMGHMGLSFTCDPRLMPDLEHMVHQVEEAMEELAELAGVNLDMPDGDSVHEHEVHGDTGFRIQAA